MSLSLNEPAPLPDAMAAPEALRPFANVRLIAFDLDGTLIDQSSGTLGPRLLKLITTVSRNNIKVTLATGRTLAGVRSILGQLIDFNRVPLVLYNGSVILRPDEHAVLAYFSIPRIAVEQVLRISANQPMASAFVYTLDSDAVLIGGNTAIEAVFFSGGGIAPKYDFNGIPVQPIAALNQNRGQVVAFLVEISDEISRNNVIKSLIGIPEISVTTSGTKYIEIRPAGSSKAAGLQRLVDQLCIHPSHVLAVGDNDNDVELLSWAGLSVSVAQSSSAARHASKYFSRYGAGAAAIDVLEIVRRAQRLFKQRNRHANQPPKSA